MASSTHAHGKAPTGVAVGVMAVGVAYGALMPALGISSPLLSAAISVPISIAAMVIRALMIRIAYDRNIVRELDTVIATAHLSVTSNCDGTVSVHLPRCANCGTRETNTSESAPNMS